MATQNGAMALQEYDEAIRQRPDDYRLYHARGELLQQLGRPEAALADWERTVQLNAIDPWLWAGLARLRFSGGDYLGAADAIGKAIELRPQIAEYYKERAIARAAGDRTVEAAADLDRALELEPGNPGYLYLRGSLARQMGRIEAALVDLNQAVATCPEDPYMYEERAEAWRASGRLEQAEADWQKAIALDPRADRLCRYAEACYGGRPADQLSILDQALRLDGTCAPALVARGRVHAALGDMVRAMADYCQATEAAPGDAAAWRGLGEVSLAQGAWEEARAAAGRAIELSPREAASYLCRARACRALGLIEAARGDLEQALGVAGDRETRGQVEAELGKLPARAGGEKRTGWLGRLRGRS